MAAKDFGERLRQLRKAKDLTQPEMADLVGLSPRFYQDVEQGRKDPSFQKFQEILGRLKMSYGEFFGEPPSTSHAKVGEMSAAQLEEIVARASKRDGTINLEVAQLRRENQQLKKTIADLGDDFWHVWNKGKSPLRDAFLFFLTGNVGYLEDSEVPAALSRVLKDLRKSFDSD
jgi:transcriptional regulator with XRE-family HTH domain